MYKWIGILCLLAIAAGCGSYPTSSGGQETLTYEDEQEGLALTAHIKVANDITVDASITNISGKTLVYNGRCGIPFGIFIKMADAHSHLVTHDNKEMSCEDIFDPGDLRNLEPNETIDKEVTFQRKIALTNNRLIGAFSGLYEVSFTFQMHGGQRFQSSLPIELNHNKEPDIMTVDEAKSAAQANNEVANWFLEQEKDEMTIKSEDAILSDGVWAVMFHAYREDRELAARIIINMDAKSGTIKVIHYEEVDKKYLQ
ncbi:hypothetical protein DNH61_04525 [Paenibacillus sambharensis]|uniref:PepSY domain-containing protein n=1 Tax=Paenibacillus sambharensis TaxID=1803190 RepID=A0A2W1LA87_9BACL|nr:hypothetical protein [Paenibacillus sambharensis]PZD97158.1 hypothetical protein DNH61_04525 [Paenibacillus sambharensis]